MAIAERFPDCPPYGGVFPDIIPHLTIAMGTGGQLNAIEHDVLPALCDPIVSAVRYCSLFVHEPAIWREAQRFPLGSNV